MHPTFCSSALRAVPAAVVVALLAGCAATPAPDTGLREAVVAVTSAHELITFHAGQPGRILERRPVTGLPAGDRLVGIDFRVAKGVLYALSQAGRLYALDIPTGALRPVGAAPAALPLVGACSALTSTRRPTASAWCPTPARTCACTPIPGLPWMATRPWRACSPTPPCVMPGPT